MSGLTLRVGEGRPSEGRATPLCCSPADTWSRSGVNRVSFAPPPWPSSRFELRLGLIERCRVAAYANPPAPTTALTRAMFSH